MNFPLLYACIWHVPPPDPILVLEQAVSQQQKLRTLQDLEVENKQLRETLNDYNTEFAQVKNQGWQRQHVFGGGACLYVAKFVSAF